MKIETPYYLIDERKLLNNLKKIALVKKLSGAKVVLALKCFSTWSVFGLMKKYMDGTTSSSLYEARLGYEKFGKETHAYCVGFSSQDISNVKNFADKIIFNSISQLKMFAKKISGKNIGLRLNPGISYSHFDLADPARKHSRLGVIDKNAVLEVLGQINGVMFHFNCENDNFESFSKMLDYLGKKYEYVLKKVEWVSLGGGIYFTKDGYPIEKFAKKLKDFSTHFGVQVYLEPGESAITRSSELVAKVVDVVYNKINVAILDISTEAHMLDLLIYSTPAKIETGKSGRYKYMVAGRSCLAGDVFGTYYFSKKLKVGDVVRITDAAGYTMVKKNWFNGLQMPSIVVRRLSGKVELVRKFDYNDFLSNLS